MNFNIHLLLSITFLLLLFSLNPELLAAVKVSQSSGNWSNGEVWGGAVPAAGDDIVISSGTIVHVDVDFPEIMVFNSIAVKQEGVLVVGRDEIKLRLKGNIVNDGAINFWLSSTYQADIFMYGNGIWSGGGSWNLSDINVQGNSLEPAEGLTLTINGSITAYPGSSFNKANKYPNVTTYIQGTINSMISSYPDFYYGHLIISKETGTVSFSPSDSSNMISFSGDLTLINSTDRLIVAAYNTLTLNGTFTGEGFISGSSTSSLVVDNLNAPSINPLRILSGTHFRDFTINRRAGVTLSNGFIIRENLRLNNASVLRLPPYTLTLGINSPNPTTGNFSGDGTFIGSKNSSLSFRGNDTSFVRLRFDQGSVANYTVKDIKVDKQVGKVMLETGELVVIGLLQVSDRNIFAIGAGTLVINNGFDLIGSACLGGSRDANLRFGGTSLTGYPLFFDQLTPFGNRLKSYTQSRNAVITLANKINISERINLTGDSSILVSNGNLTLLSSSEGSANISSLLNKADVLGEVNVQVYVSGDNKNLVYRGFRSFSSPINDDLIPANNKKSLAQLKDYIIITGPGGTSNGFDQGGASQPYAQTLLFYNPLALSGQSLFTPVDNINQTVSKGSGFFAFFRGRQMGNYSSNFNKLNFPYLPPEPVTIVYNGPINKRNISPVVLRTSQASSDDYRGYNLVGNPFPSSIDWTKVERTQGVSDQVLIVKPGGGYASYSNGFSNNGGSPYIQTGQGFYVRTAIDGSSVTFREDCKTSFEPARLLNAPLDIQLSSKILLFNGAVSFESRKQVLRLNLSQSANNQVPDSDETTMVFSEGSNPESDFDDVMYFEGSSVSLASLSSDDKKMAINFLPGINRTDTVKLFINATASGSYNLNFTEVPSPASRVLYLKDSLLNYFGPVKNDLSYRFQIDKNNPGTFGSKRFSLIFRSIQLPKAKTHTIASYPNPAREEITFAINSLPKIHTQLMIYNTQGRVMEDFNFLNDGRELTLSISWLEPGLYIARFKSDEGILLGRTVFIKH